MEIVADTNIFLAVALDGPERKRILQLTSGTAAAAPEILPYEIGNALSAMVKRQKLTESEALQVEQSAMRVAVRLVSVDIQASLRIALTHNIYAYDAYFLQCALRLSRPLFTLDRRMKQVADQIGVKVVE